ncbi:MAG: hypothetical protein KGN32_05805 [Burkholderiales bacterium]|nr:hypothetical protein [Burkholderiales bacterium]
MDQEVPALRAINLKVTQPYKGFHRKIGELAGHRISPAGTILSEAEWASTSIR